MSIIRYYVFVLQFIKQTDKVRVKVRFLSPHPFLFPSLRISALSMFAQLLFSSFLTDQLLCKISPDKHLH